MSLSPFGSHKLAYKYPSESLFFIPVCIALGVEWFANPGLERGQCDRPNSEVVLPQS